MELFLLLFIILMIVAFASIGGFLYMEWLRRDQQYVRGHFIYDDENFKIKKFKNIDKKLEFENKTYTYDDKAVLRRNKRRYIFYRIDVPTPLVFEGTGQPEFSATNLKTLLSNNLTDRLFRTNTKELAFLKMLMFILIIGVVALGIFLYMKLDNSVAITSAENKEFIIQAVRDALV